MKKGNKEDANLLHAHLQPQTDSDNGAHATLAKHCLYKSGASLNTKIWSHESILIISTHLGEHKQSDVGQDLLLQDVVGSLAGRHLEELLKEEGAVQVGPQLAHRLPDGFDQQENCGRLHNMWKTFLRHKSAELVNGQLDKGGRFLRQMAG